MFGCKVLLINWIGCLCYIGIFLLQLMTENGVCDCSCLMNIWLTAWIWIDVCIWKKKQNSVYIEWIFNAQIFICTHLIDTFVERLFRNRVRVDSRARMPSIVLVRGVYYCYSNPSMKCFVFVHCSTMYSNRLAASCCCGVWIRSVPVYNLVRRHFVVVVD